MPCRLIDGLHEWRNEISTVPSQSLPNTSFWCKDQRCLVGRKDPVELYCSMLLQCGIYCAVQVGVAMAQSPDQVQTKLRYYPLSSTLLTKRDNCMQTVWLGRHPFEKISKGPNGKLIQFRNLEQSARAKACLTVSSSVRDAGAKAWSSEPLYLFNGGQRLQKSYLGDSLEGIRILFFSRPL